MLDVLGVVYGTVHLAVGSFFPLLVGLFLWRVRARPFTARFTETALEVDEPPLEVAYADLQGLIAPRRPANPFKAGPRSYGIWVIHREGVLQIPGRLDVPSDDVYGFLFGRFSPGGSRDLPELLAPYLRHKERAYGAERVWSYRARARWEHGLQPRRLRAFFLALLLSGVVWLIWGSVRGEAGWVVPGATILICGGLFTWYFWLMGRQPRYPAGRRGRKSGLVISPEGLALVQKDLVGELRWDELRDVKLLQGNSWQFYAELAEGRSATFATILLKVEGAAIVIADVYDRPLALIYQNICHYWRGKARADEDSETVRHWASEPNRAAAPEASFPPSSPNITPPK
jgi:hypothetical protein